MKLLWNSIFYYKGFAMRSQTDSLLRQVTDDISSNSFCDDSVIEIESKKFVFFIIFTFPHLQYKNEESSRLEKERSIVGNFIRIHIFILKY